VEAERLSEGRREGHNSPLGAFALGDSDGAGAEVDIDLGVEWAEVQLAVLVDAHRAVGVGEQSFQVIEVAAHLLVDDGQSVGEGGGHGRQLKDLGALGGPGLGGDQVGGGVGVAPGAFDPDLT